MKLTDIWVGARRQEILRLLAKTQSGNEQVICTALERRGYSRDPHSAFRADLDYLVKIGCLTEEWIDDMRVVTLTERGGDAAHGRIEVPGVASERG